MGSGSPETSEGWLPPRSKAEDSGFLPGPGFSPQMRQAGPGSGFKPCLTSLSLLFMEARIASPRPYECSVSISSVIYSEQLVMEVEPGWDMGAQLIGCGWH